MVLFDEFGWSFQERLRRTWAPRGQRPLIRRLTQDRRVLSTAVGLTLSGKIYKRHFTGSMKSCHFIEMLEHLRQFMPQGFVLVCDRAGIHKSNESLFYLFGHPEIVVEPLPKYAPELNPEEYCHGNVKTHLANALPTCVAHMRQMLDRGFARLRRRPDLLLSFFHAAGLSVKQLWRN